MAARRVVIGVDVGTSVAKAAAFDERGAVVARAARPVALSRPSPGWVEQDVDEVWSGVVDVLAEVRGVVDGAEVAHLGVTAQGDGCWLVDADARPVRPAVSWMDARASTLVEDWEADGTAARVFDRSGSALFPGSQAAVLAWLDRHEPEVLDRAATAAYCKDVVFQRLTGERGTDVSEASVAYGRAPGRGGAGDYDPDSLADLGAAHRSELLAPVARPLPLGHLAPAPATSTGLAPGTTVTSGPYDLAACLAGAGVSTPGDGLLIVGTTLACLVPTRFDAPDPRPGALPGGPGDRAGLLLQLPGDGAWLRAMPAMVGTASLDWVLRLVGVEHQRLGELLADSPPGAGGVRALPHLSLSGERAPFVDTAARGQLTGVSVTTTAADVVRAVCEGLGFAARQCFEAAGLTGSVVTCGGGTASRPWLELFASALGRPVTVAGAPEVGALGAVLSAFEHVPDQVAVPQGWGSWVRPAETIDPDPDLVERYEAGYASYLADQHEARARWHR